jgi:integrase
MSVYKRRGRWFCDITIDGRRVQRVIKGARSRAQALKAAASIEGQLFTKRYRLEEREEVRFDKFVDEVFLPYSKMHKKSYADDVRHCRMLKEHFGRMNLSEIKPTHVEKFKLDRLEGETMYKRKRHPATVNRELCVLSKILSIAFDRELIESNPCRRVRKLRAECSRVRYLSDDEEAALFEALSDYEWVMNVVTAALHTGMRQGEIFNLTWFNVDLGRGVINVRQTKSGKDRYVPINQTMRELLERLPRASAYVFPSPKTGGRIVDVKTTFDAAKREAKIDNFRFHDLRHTAATRMADAGADAFTLASIFGWSDVRMALRYTHATDEARRRAVENLSKPGPPRDGSVTKEKRQAGGPAVSD